MGATGLAGGMSPMLASSLMVTGSSRRTKIRRLRAVDPSRRRGGRGLPRSIRPLATAGSGRRLSDARSWNLSDLSHCPDAGSDRPRLPWLRPNIGAAVTAVDCRSSASDETTSIPVTSCGQSTHRAFVPRSKQSNPARPGSGYRARISERPQSRSRPSTSSAASSPSSKTTSPASTLPAPTSTPPNDGKQSSTTTSCL